MTKPDEAPVTWGELREAARILTQLLSAVDLYSAAGISEAVSGQAGKSAEFERQVRALATEASTFFGPDVIKGFISD